MGIEQVNVTRNQSMAKITLEHIFLFDNRYDKVTLGNVVAAGTIVLAAGDLLYKRTATLVDKLTDVDANIAAVVGIAAMEDDLSVLDTVQVAINMCVEGTIDEDKINLPGGMTLDDVIPTTNLTLRDHLNQLGFHLETGIDNTKFDNE